MITLPILVTDGELLGAKLSPSGDIEVKNLSHVFVETPRLGDSSATQVHVMTFDYFEETFARQLRQVREATIH
jgi:hypothetical protein